jgi:16S rRNA (cytidine1402-2'-O)-methyltransferase
MTNNTLYVVATPIGNLDDITLRAIDVLKQVDVVAAEDTRHSRRLLDHLGIHKPMIAIHDHNERSKIDQVTKMLNDGQSLALISDAGTPLISDPGYPLVNACRELGHNVVPIPGACALVSALCAAGLPTDRFAFEGFLPAKIKGRRDRLLALLNDDRTLMFYESTHRIQAMLKDVAELYPDRKLVIARELTKRFETFLTGRATELLAVLAADADQLKGEFVVMMQGAPAKAEEGLNTEDLRIFALLLGSLSLKSAAQMAAQITGKPKKGFYQYGLSMKNQGAPEE